MSDKSGGFFSSVGRFFSSSASKNKDAEKSFEAADETAPTSSDAASSSSPTSENPSAFLKDIISMDNGDAVESEDTAEPRPTRSSPAKRTSRGLRYLSPSALEVDVEPAADIFFTTPFESTRKRQLTELDKQTLPQSFRSESVKRGRFLNRSLMEPTLKNTFIDRNETWCGELAANHSPASSITNFSLLSRRSGATTNGSLSTRTQEIYKKLEGAGTPSREVQRTSMLRYGLSRPEKWAPTEETLSFSPINAPPLKKSGDGIPSRIQLISKAIPPRKTPYWRDLTRKRGESVNGGDGAASSDTHSLKSLNGNFAAAELSSLFSLDPPPATRKTSASTTSSIVSTTTAPKHVAILKGPDGKSVGRNTFKLDDEDSEDSQPPPLSAALLSNPQPLKLAPGTAAPNPGFLSNLAFSFSAPIVIDSLLKTASSSASSTCEETTAEKASSESSSSSESDSDASEEAEEDSEAEQVKESRPHTSADTISTANGSNQSSKDSSPKIIEKAVVAPTVSAPAPVAPAAAAMWTCDECFTSWPASNDKCGCCATPKPGSTAASAPSKPAEKQLVSNLAAFAPSKPASGGAFAFGFGGGASTSAAPAPTSTAAAPKPFGFGSGAPAASSASTSLFGASKPAAPVAPAPVAPAPIAAAPVAPAPAPAPSTDRVDWSCPDCFVSNKATDDRCPCCSHVKYQPAAGAAPANVFGARAFNPTASTAAPTMSFGFGTGSASASAKTDATAPAATAPTASFGFSAPAAPAPSAPVAPAPAKLPEVPKPAGSLFGSLPKAPAPLPASTPAPTVAAPATSTVPLFGSTSLFGSQKPAAPTTEAAPKPSLFGSSSSASTTTPAAPVLAPVTSAPAPSLFGASSTSSTPFGNTSLFGASAPKPPAVTEAPKPTSTLSFGGSAAPTSTTEAPKTGLFGSAAPATAPAPSSTPSNSLFGAGSSTSGLFGKPADSTTSSTTTSSLFGAKKPLSFGGDVGTTTTDGGAPAKRGMFSLDSAPAAAPAPKLAFGGSGFGTGSAPAPTSTGSSLFGGSGSSMFGGNAPTSSTIPFGSSTTAAKPFGSSGTVPFGGAAPAAPAFGGFGKPSQPGMSTSSSTNSLFGAAPDSSNPFASVTSSSNNNGGGFNFSSSSSTTSTSSNNGGVFQFGGSAAPAPLAPAAAPSGQPFPAFGGLPPAPAPGSMDNNAFAYQAPTGTGARKMAMARRRNIRK